MFNKIINYIVHNNIYSLDPNIYDIDKVDILSINEDSLIESTDGNYQQRLQIYLLLEYLYFKKKMSSQNKEVAHLSYLISWYLFIILIPMFSEDLALGYAEEAIKFDPCKKYEDWKKTVLEGN